MVESGRDPFPPHGVDLEHPSVARVYDYLLGGTTNWAVDREFADRALREFPPLRAIARANRLFLHRVVRHLLRLGIRQFVDIGSGLPTMGHTHQIADEMAPDHSRVVYVDSEPVVVAHSQLLLEQDGDPTRHAVVHADLRDPDRLWRQVADTGVVDLEQPVGLLLIAVLHNRQPGTDGADVGARSVARYRQLVRSGSYLAISHITDHGIPDEFRDKLAGFKRMCDASGNPAIWRSRNQIDELFGDFRLIEPGTTWTPSWHPEESSPEAPAAPFHAPNESVVWAGVAQKS